MYPMPPRPLFHGSRAASAKPEATAASTALPPAASISAPTSAARRCWEATMPRRERAAGFRTCQFCVWWPRPGFAPGFLIFELEASTLVRRAFVEKFSRRLHAHELRTLGREPLDQALQRQHAVAAADDERVEGVGDDSPIRLALHVEEIVDPVGEHSARVHEARQHGVLRAHELEVRVVVERPADRHLDQARFLAEYRGLLQLDPVAEPNAVRGGVVPHHAAFVIEAVLEKQLDRMRAQVPRRRAVAAGVAAGEFPDLFVRAHQLRFLLLAREARRRHVRPAVMADFMARLQHTPTCLRISLEGMPRDEPGGGNAEFLEQRQYARGADHAELAARHRRRRGHAARDPAGNRVEIKSDADDVLRHALLAFRCRA